MGAPSPALAAGIQAGSGIVESGLNWFAQGTMNKKARKWQEKMYALQRKNALEDWQLQNQYNHPSSQMARLREAGLNPNLVYGSGAQMQSANIRSTETGSWTPKAPQFQLQQGATNALMSYYDVEVKQAQIDNLRMSNTVMQQEAMLKAAQIVGTHAGTSQKEVITALRKKDLQYVDEIKQLSVDAARTSIQNTLANTEVTLNRDEREAALNASNLREAAERILVMRIGRAKTKEEIINLKAQLANIVRDVELKQLDIDLKKNGVQPTDALWQRVLARILAHFQNK